MTSVQYNHSTIHYLQFTFHVYPDTTYEGCYQVTIAGKLIRHLRYDELYPVILELVDMIPEENRKHLLKDNYT